MNPRRVKTAISPYLFNHITLNTPNIEYAVVPAPIACHRAASQQSHMKPAPPTITFPVEQSTNVVLTRDLFFFLPGQVSPFSVDLERS